MGALSGGRLEAFEKTEADMLVYMDDSNPLPEQCTLTLLVCDKVKESHNVYLLAFSPLGIIWRGIAAHPNSHTFSPWHRVVSIDW